MDTGSKGRMQRRRAAGIAGVMLLLMAAGCRMDTDLTLDSQIDLEARIIQCEAGRTLGPGGFLPGIWQNDALPDHIRARAALAMGRIGNPAALPALLAGPAPAKSRISSSRNQPVYSVELRSSRLFALGEILDYPNMATWRARPPVDAEPEIRQAALHDPAIEVRARAVEALAKMTAPPAPGAAPATAGLSGLAPAGMSLQEEPARLYAREWIKAVLRLQDRQCENQLAGLLDSPVRTEALIALTRMAPPPPGMLNVPAERVRKLCEDQDPLVRALALRAWSSTATPPAITDLTRYINDPAPGVRIAALRLLGRKKGQIPANILKTFIENRLARHISPGDSRLAHIYKELETALVSLGQTGYQQALRWTPGLAGWIKQNNYLAPFCAQTWTALDPAAALPPRPDFSSQARAQRWLQAVAASQHPSAQAFLKDLEQGRWPSGWPPAWREAFRPAVLASLLKLEPAALPGRLPLLFNDPDPYVRTAALEHLAGLPPAGQEPWLGQAAEAAARFPDPATMDPLVAAIPLLAKAGAAGEKQLRDLLLSRYYRVRLLAAGALYDLGQTGIFSKVQPLPPEDLDTCRLSVILRQYPCSAELVTNKGVISLVFDRAAAPLTTQNFLDLAASGYFNGITFHRVVPEFVAQAGCPLGNGNGGPDHYAIPCEINPLRYTRGAVGMALSGRDTGGSQFFITLTPQPHLEGGYTVFARVSGGMSVADNLLEGDTIVNVKLYWDFPSRVRDRMHS